jgi:hypothetical protein
MDLVKSSHAKGWSGDWTVYDPEVHIDCNLAWIAYVNRGNFERPSEKKEIVWLESAILEYAQGRWRIRFLHSTKMKDH